MEPHLCHPFSGEAWPGPVPQEKDGSPLLRWSPPPFPRTLHESSYSVSPVQPTLDFKHPPSPPPSMHLVSGLGDWTLSIGSRAPSPTSNSLPVSPASQKRRKLPCFLLSFGERCLVVANGLIVGQDGE